MFILTIIESLLYLCVKRVYSEEGADDEHSSEEVVTDAEEGSMEYEEEAEMSDKEDVSV
jgi:hypothetical protein